MRDAEGVPEDYVGVFDRGVGRGGDPGGEALRGGPGGLGDVSASRVDFGVGVCVGGLLVVFWGMMDGGCGWMMMD